MNPALRHMEISSKLSNFVTYVTCNLNKAPKTLQNTKNWILLDETSILSGLMIHFNLFLSDHWLSNVINGVFL